MESFLTSELGVALPLHVSLTRPVVVGAGGEGGVFEGGGGGGGGGTGGVWVGGQRGGGVASYGGGRSFLVLRVESLVRKGRGGGGLGGGDDGDAGDGGDDNPNPELTGLLRRCNAVVKRYGQPGLYEWAEDGRANSGKRIGEAFHVSIAWSFAEPTEELVRATERVFGARIGPETSGSADPRRGHQGQDRECGHKLGPSATGGEGRRKGSKKLAWVIMPTNG